MKRIHTHTHRNSKKETQYTQTSDASSHSKWGCTFPSWNYSSFRAFLSSLSLPLYLAIHTNCMTHAWYKPNLKFPTRFNTNSILRTRMHCNQHKYKLFACQLVTRIICKHFSTTSPIPFSASSTIHPEKLVRPTETIFSIFSLYLSSRPYRRTDDVDDKLVTFNMTPKSVRWISHR